MTEPIQPKAPIRTAAIAADAPLEKAAPLEQPPLRSADFGALRLELARRQLRLIDAQKYVQQALATSPLVETDIKLEEGCSAILRNAARGLEVDDVELTAVVEHALRSGAAGLSKLIEIVEWQRRSYKLENEDPYLGATLDRLASIAFDQLRDRPKTDRKAAMQSMLAAGDALGCGFSTTALYLNFHFDYEKANGFTNESGLPRLIESIDTTGGAVVGVGGAVFDIGSTGSDMIISVDASSLIADCIHTFTGILLAVDELVQKNGWDDVRRAEEVQLRLTRGSHPDTIAELTGLLTARAPATGPNSARAVLGRPAQLRDNLPKVLDALAKKLAGESEETRPIPQDLWCRSDRQVERVLHLTRLALEGRIVALTADLADPRIGERVNALLRAHGTVAKVVHFSNALDYVADIRGACRSFGAIDLHPNALLTTTCGPVFKHPVMAAEPDGYTIIHQLGVNDEPAANRASAWLGKNRLGDMLHDIAWDTGVHVRNLVDWTRSLLLLNAEYPTPSNIEQYRELVDRMVADAFADPEDARSLLMLRLTNLGRLAAYEMVDKSPLTGLSFPLPQTFGDLIPIADQIDAQFWSRGDRKQRYIGMMLDRLEIDPRSIPDLAAQARDCRSYDDLRELELSLSEKARLAQTGPGGGQHEAERA